MATPPSLPEPAPCYGAFSAHTDGLHYFWKGWGPRLRENLVITFDIYTEHWSVNETDGMPPPGVVDGQCTSLGNKLFLFGGSDGAALSNDLFMLDTESLKWRKMATRSDPLYSPIPKKGCGLIAVRENTLACFGGHGICQNPATPLFIRDENHVNGSGWTSELHLFHVDKDVWSSPRVVGRRPPPSAAFSFTEVDQHRAVLFGGKQPGKGRVSDLYVLTFTDTAVTVTELRQRGPRPVERSGHAACCLNWGEEQPVVLVSGGVDKENTVLADLWLLNVNTGTWTEVTPGPDHPVKPRYWHSTTATCLGSGLAEVLVYGGCEEWKTNVKSFNSLIAMRATTILRFELTSSLTPSLTASPAHSTSSPAHPTPNAEPSPEQWALVGVTDNKYRGANYRIREKVRRMVESRVRTYMKQLSVGGMDLHSLRENEEVARATIRELTEKNEKLTKDLRQMKESLYRANQRARAAEQKLIFSPTAPNEIQELNARLDQLTDELQRVQTENRYLTESQDLLCAENQRLSEAQRISDEENRHVSEALRQVQAENQHFLEAQRISDKENRRLSEVQRISEKENRRLSEAQRISDEENCRLSEALSQAEAENQRLTEALQEFEAHDIEPWKVARDKVEVLEEIAVGGWGSISKGTVCVAIKKLHEAILNPRNIERLRREMNILARVRHPHLLQFIGAVFDDKVLDHNDPAPPLIITELMDTNLRRAYEQEQLPEHNKLPIFIQVAKALVYLHHRHEPIIHRDVSAPNVLLQRTPNGDWKGKLSDLGSANLARVAQTLGEGAILYSAPEAIPSASKPDAPMPKQTVKVDVYSYGVLLCEVIVGQLPEAYHYSNMLRQVERDWSYMHRLIVSCTKESPDDRPDMKYLVTKLEGIDNH